MNNYTSFANSHTGTVFIPDISGFTHFINHTEISHSQHIITELLELIIKETSDMFQLSEIEGDGNHFYPFFKWYIMILPVPIFSLVSRYQNKV